MKRGICTAVGIVGCLASLIYVASLIGAHNDTPEQRVGILMDIVATPILGFIIPYNIAGLLLLSGRERALHRAEVSQGRRGAEAFSTMFLFGGNLELLLLSGFTSVKHWCFTLAFLVLFFHSARQFLLGGKEDQAPQKPRGAPR
ncbi:MAG: hypothetical protein JXR94_05680 [Candidatus Hydrogenedentes bacterium]|nr:hypothetical protein [Candidatus Hydrogenedentota bacterium]